MIEIRHCYELTEIKNRITEAQITENNPASVFNAKPMDCPRDRVTKVGASLADSDAERKVGEDIFPSSQLNPGISYGE
jgi:hypothetical protein